MSQPQVTAVQTVAALEKQLMEATVEAYQAREKLEATEVRLKALRAALGGVQLGQRVSAEAAAVEPVQP